jgi:ABC-type cobalt transport system substrate-binding protein
VKKLLLVVALSTIGILMFASVASAQSGGSSASASPSASGSAPASGCSDCGGYVRHPTHSTSAPASASPAPNIPPSGGTAILLPAVALLLGSGILTYAILRRR